MVKQVDRMSKPVKFEFGKIHIAGGFTSTPSSVTLNTTIEGTDKKQNSFEKMAVGHVLAERPSVSHLAIVAVW